MKLLSLLIRLLPVPAIVFQAGISGAWWSAQFYAPLPPAWGVFGAALIGLAMFAGVDLAVRGRRIGWPLAMLAGLADAAMGIAYFGANHVVTMAAILAIVPMAITLLTAKISTEAAAQIAAADAAAADAERRHQHHLAELRLQAELAAQAAHADAERQAALIEARARARALTGHDRTTVQTPDNARTPDRTPVRPPDNPAERVRWLSSNPDAYDPADLASAWGVHERTARRALSAAGYHANGDGRWHRT